MKQIKDTQAASRKQGPGRLPLLLVAIGLLLIIVGAGGLFAIYQSRTANIGIVPPSISAAPVLGATVGYVSGNPVSLTIPSLGLSLPVIAGTYDARTGTWTLTPNKVQYATMTPLPNNQAGNTFLYGHYRSGVFASLHTIKAGAEAMLKTDNGHTFYYQLTGVTVVSPSDSAGIFAYQGKPIMTIQTCTGLFFQNRQLFTFNLMKVA